MLVDSFKKISCRKEKKMRKRNLITDLDRVILKLMDIYHYHNLQTDELKEAIQILEQIKIQEIIEEGIAEFEKGVVEDVPII